jgi:hypothetical protein
METEVNFCNNHLPKKCHPEQSTAASKASRRAESKDTYTSGISRLGEGVSGGNPGFYGAGKMPQNDTAATIT